MIVINISPQYTTVSHVAWPLVILLLIPCSFCPVQHLSNDVVPAPIDLNLVLVTTECLLLVAIVFFHLFICTTCEP